MEHFIIEDDDIEFTKKTNDAIAFEIVLEDKPKTKLQKAPSLKSAKHLQSDVQARVAAVDRNRKEFLRQKGEAARVDAIKREEFTRRRVMGFKERAEIKSQLILDKAAIEANLEILGARCKLLEEGVRSLSHRIHRKLQSPRQ